ncbi:MAG: sugar transferase [Albidovulum sp.]
MAAPQFEFRDAVATEDRTGLYQAFGKRAFDVTMVILAAPAALLILSVVLIVTWICGGTPLYGQSRIGRDGNVFRCWKVRTMVRDADAVLARVLHSDPALAEEWLHSQKLSNDPRITRLGRFLRRTSIDELPQLWNVLCGDMSLVGPRPFMTEQQGLYRFGRPDADYYQMRPGITGLWQVGRRNRASFAERADYDEAYFQTLSLGTDMQILLRTIGVVCRATGI